jgi:glycerol kinase
MKYILTLDQGTTSCRTIIYNQLGKATSIAQLEYTQIYPQAGWVEHNALEIWNTQLQTVKDAMAKAKIQYTDIEAIGITNQRETTVVWDKNTGTPIGNAIVWQDRRTAAICDQLKAEEGMIDYVRQNTGLVIDAYFSGTKLKWLLDNTLEARQKAENGDLLFGTIDSWLIWNLTKGKEHVTDYSNASRTMLFNIVKLDWDNKMLSALNIPKNVLPKVKSSSGYLGKTDKSIFEGAEIPITGVAGDQQAALFGQACFQEGMAKNTYGTGCFMLMNTGNHLFNSQSGLISTIAWGIEGQVEYALEGSVFIAGSAIKWLRDGLKILEQATDSEYFAKKVKSAEGVYVVPAFAGLGTPYWDMYARGAIFGLTQGTTKNHLIRATLDSLAYQTKDVLMAMEKDTQIRLKALRVDGGASVNNLLMQFQADILGTDVQRPDDIESTARGAAYLAGIGAKLWTKDEVAKLWELDKSFKPKLKQNEVDKLYKGWQEAVKRSMGWTLEI